MFCFIYNANTRNNVARAWKMQTTDADDVDNANDANDERDHQIIAKPRADGELAACSLRVAPSTRSKLSAVDVS